MSPPISGSATPESPQKDLPPSQHADIGRVRVEDDKAVDGKKKKAKKRSAGAKKRGTGFEEFFCDPPMTPGEYNEERNAIYPPHRPFVDRIEECIQRFRARRRMSSELETLFTRYLLLGGIDASVRQFQGTRNIGDEILDEATNAAVREMTADDVIHRAGEVKSNPRFYNPNNSEHWEVDFTGVASGFLSEHLPKMVGSDSSDFRMGVDVVLNFLRYVDHHEVCPEYADDIKRAQDVCFRALGEIPAIGRALALMPGHFNTSLRVLHCKGQADSLSDFFWTANPDPKSAKIARATTISILFGPNRFPADREWRVTREVDLTFEILSIALPNDDTRSKYGVVNRHLVGHPAIQPCGTLVARPVIIRDGWDNSTWVTIPADLDREFQFILEEDILSRLTAGMKLTMGICILDVGLVFIKYVKEIRPSFYVFLAQELMINYKEPAPNERPARSVDDGNDAEGDGDD